MLLPNAYGHFSDDGREYIITRPDTPAPLQAARGRMPDVQRLFRQVGDAARQARQQLDKQSE